MPLCDESLDESLCVCLREFCVNNHGQRRIPSLGPAQEGFEQRHALQAAASRLKAATVLPVAITSPVSFLPFDREGFDLLSGSFLMIDIQSYIWVQGSPEYE